VPAQFDNTPSNCFYVGQQFLGCVLQVRVTAMADTNSQTDLIWGCHALINVNQCSMTYFTTLNNDSPINPLTPELNPSAQRCLTRFLLENLLLEPCTSLMYAWKNQQMQQLFIQFINYVWYLLLRHYIAILRKRGDLRSPRPTPLETTHPSTIFYRLLII
jgi:hypothetical protein